MKYVIKKLEAKILEEHGISRFTEYASPISTLTTGVSEIHGKYPASGFDVDEDVDASWYVVSGTGRIFVGDEVHKVAEGDIIFVPRGDKFWIEGDALKLVVTSCPPWNPAQHKHVVG